MGGIISDLLGEKEQENSNHNNNELIEKSEDGQLKSNILQPQPQSISTETNRTTTTTTTTTWWFLQGSDKNLSMFDKATAFSKPTSYSLEYVINIGPGKYFFIWKLSEGKTVKQWGKWFLFAYSAAIGLPPPEDSGEEDPTITTTSPQENPLFPTPSASLSQPPAPEDNPNLNLNPNPNTETSTESPNDNSSRSDETSGSDSSEKESDSGAEEIQISEPQVPPLWGQSLDAKYGQIWYIGYKVIDMEIWIESQYKAPDGFICIFFTKNCEPQEEDEGGGWLVHTLWRSQIKPKKSIFRNFSSGLLEEDNNILILSVEEPCCRGFIK
jgi:hypothetical protein